MRALKTTAALILVGLALMPASVSGQYTSSHVSFTFDTEAVFGGAYSYSSSEQGYYVDEYDFHDPCLD